MENNLAFLAKKGIFLLKLVLFQAMYMELLRNTRDGQLIPRVARYYQKDSLFCCTFEIVVNG